MILGGHQRVEAFKRLLAAAGKTDAKIPVVYLDGVDDDKAKALNLALNKISGDWDYDKLAALFDGLTEATLDLSGFAPPEIADIVGLLGEGSAPEREPEPEMDVDEELAKQARKFTFEVADDAEAAICRGVLAEHGMTGPGNAGAAFVAAMRSAEKAESR